ncbi:ABC transporter permease [Candidatus Bipolaricaulota bacterium]|nr:ABC transporter permease [Candidatus Bipolaricaulota bacterium]
MVSYIIRRLLQGIIVLLGVSFISFVIFQFVGDPTLALAGKYATQEQIQEVRESLRLDKPFYVQYLIFIKNAVQGNFGNSYIQEMPALDLILAKFPATAELATVAILISGGLGISLGVLVSLNRDSGLSRMVMAGSLFGISVPTFLIGTLLIMVFAVYLRCLPPMGRGETIKLGFWKTGFLTLSGWRHIILPAFTLGMYSLAVLIRLTRSEMVEILGKDYIRTAWAKGLSSRFVIFKHALRNGLIPVVTMMGMQFGQLIAFSIITETIFQWPGMGRLLLRSIYNNDRPIIVTYIMLAATVILTLNIIVDIMYAFLNPKIRYG